MTLEQEILQVVNQIVPTIEKAFYDVFVLRHPGHPNQKTHGNRFGSTDAAKESLRRLKDDKVSREKYKATARKKLGLEAKPNRNKTEIKPLPSSKDFVVISDQAALIPPNTTRDEYYKKVLSVRDTLKSSRDVSAKKQAENIRDTVKGELQKVRQRKDRVDSTVDKANKDLKRYSEQNDLIMYMAANKRAARAKQEVERLRDWESTLNKSLEVLRQATR